MSNDELIHYGVLGMKWGHRKSKVTSVKTTKKTAKKKAKYEPIKNIKKKINSIMQYEQVKQVMKQHLYNSATIEAVKAGQTYANSILKNDSAQVNDAYNHYRQALWYEKLANDI